MTNKNTADKESDRWTMMILGSTGRTITRSPAKKYLIQRVRIVWQLYCQPYDHNQATITDPAIQTDGCHIGSLRLHINYRRRTSSSVVYSTYNKKSYFLKCAAKIKQIIILFREIPKIVHNFKI